MDILELVHGSNEPAPRRFACLEAGCGKSFSRKSDLARHARIHANDRPYACEWNGCGKAFIQRSALTVHMRVHTGERPHACEVKGCGKAFGDSSSLARHRRVHTGARPYYCPQAGCDKTFCRKITLTKHMKRHHPYASPMSPILPCTQMYSSTISSYAGTPLFGSPAPQSEGSPCPSSPALYSEEGSELPMAGLGICIPSRHGGPSLSVPPLEVFPRSPSVVSHQSAFSAPSMQQAQHMQSYTNFDTSYFEQNTLPLPPSPSDVDLQRYSSHQIPQYTNVPVMMDRPSLPSIATPPYRATRSVPSPFRWSDSKEHMSTLQDYCPSSPRTAGRERFDRFLDDAPYRTPESPIFSRFTNAAINFQPIPSPTWPSYFSLSSPTQRNFPRSDLYDWDIRRCSTDSREGRAAFSHPGDANQVF